MFFDPLYLLMVLPALGLSLWASFKTKSAFNKYSKVLSMRGLSGAQAARRLLSYAGISDVKIVQTAGMLSDHYNPTNKTLALSENVYRSSSVAAIGVACHEAGHAIQHAEGYGPLWLRSVLVPTANIGSSVGYIVMFLGLLFSMTNLVLVGAVLFSAVLAFQVVTLPVEFDASARAKRLAVEQGIITAQERRGVDRVLNAAALTYVAAAVSTLMTLLYSCSAPGFWEAGTTEALRSPLVDAMKRHPHILNQAHAALLVVDVQTRLTRAIRNGRAMVDEIVKLVRGFRILGLPIFVTEQYPKGLGHTESRILEALGGNSAVEKATFSCCGAPGLVSDMRNRGIRQILLTGTEAHVCVQQTALDLLAREFQVQLAVNAVSSRKELDYRTALDRMARSGVILTSVESALFELLEVSGTAEFKQVASLIK